MRRKRDAGFTLIEMLMVTGIMGLILTLLMPAIRMAVERSRVTQVYSDLRQVEVALTLYYSDHRKYPRVRVSCNSSEQSHWCQLPPELVTEGYLPPSHKPGLSSSLEDPFNPEHTYKYATPGPYYLNNALQKYGFPIFVPDDFPSNHSNGGSYHNTDDSPLAWVVWSLGPRQDHSKAFHSRAPVSRDTWYYEPGDHGVIARIQHRGGISFQTP